MMELNGQLRLALSIVSGRVHPLTMTEQQWRLLCIHKPEQRTDYRAREVAEDIVATAIEELDANMRCMSVRDMPIGRASW